MGRDPLLPCALWKTSCDFQILALSGWGGDSCSDSCSRGVPSLPGPAGLSIPPAANTENGELEDPGFRERKLRPMITKDWPRQQKTELGLSPPPVPGALQSGCLLSALGIQVCGQEMRTPGLSVLELTALCPSLYLPYPVPATVPAQAGFWRQF